MNLPNSRMLLQALPRHSSRPFLKRVGPHPWMLLLQVGNGQMGEAERGEEEGGRGERIIRWIGERAPLLSFAMLACMCTLTCLNL